MNGEWFECKIQIAKEQEDGSEKLVTETYLVDALTFTEAEERITSEMEPYIRGEFKVAGIRKVKLAELVDSEDPQADRWYRAKIETAVIDEKTAKEKKSTFAILVKGSSIRTALTNAEERLASGDFYTIKSVTETAIIEVYQWVSKNA